MASTQEQLLEQLVAAQKILEPQLRTLRTITSALQQAIKTAKEDRPDAFAFDFARDLKETFTQRGQNRDSERM